MITLKDYYMGRDVKYGKDLTVVVMQNAAHTVDLANELLTFFGSPRGCNSGWRPKALQMEVNPRAPNSKHITAEAIDIEDKDGNFKRWCVANELLLASLGLHMEDPGSTPTWVHIQTVPPKSGRVIFVP